MDLDWFTSRWKGNIELSSSSPPGKKFYEKDWGLFIYIYKYTHIYMFYYLSTMLYCICFALHICFTVYTVCFTVYTVKLHFTKHCLLWQIPNLLLWKELDRGQDTATQTFRMLHLQKRKDDSPPRLKASPTTRGRGDGAARTPTAAWQATASPKEN